MMKPTKMIKKIWDSIENRPNFPEVQVLNAIHENADRDSGLVCFSTFLRNWK